MEKAQQLRYHFPEEMLLNILEKLPIKCLIRFKTVCKSWDSIIQKANEGRTKKVERRRTLMVDVGDYLSYYIIRRDLGPTGVNLDEFIKAYDERTVNTCGLPVNSSGAVNVRVKIYDDKSFTFKFKRYRIPVWSPGGRSTIELLRAKRSILKVLA